MEDIIKELNSSEIFKSLSKEELDAFLNNSNFIKYKKGETICKQGGFANHVILVLQGFAKTYIEGPNDKNLVIEILKPFELYGLNSAFYGNTYNLSLASITETYVCFVEKSIVEKTIESNFQFSKEILKFMSRRSVLYYNKISSFGNKQLHGRFADALLYLSKEIVGSEVLDLALTRKEIGEIAGISTESTIRLLSELNHDGILKLEGKKIIIAQMKLLEKLSEIG